MRFLLVEDNADLASSVSERLQLDGHAVDVASSLEQAESCTSGITYDLILLDIMLPDGNGQDFLNSQRRTSSSTPVIIMTAQNSVSDRVALLDSGADDYVTKPFDFAELEARCRAVLRRRGGSAQNTIVFGDMQFDPLAATIRIGDQTRTLRNRELRLLEILLSSPARLFSKAHLVDRLFSYSEDPSENAIEVYVGRLRKKIEGSSAKIETVRGVGYRILSE